MYNALSLNALTRNYFSVITREIKKNLLVIKRVLCKKL